MPPPDGEGYHALVDGVKVYVPPELVMPSRASRTPQSSVTTEVPAVDRSLTKSGPPVKGWSWKVSARKAAFQRSALLASSTSTTSLANSFAALAVDPPARS